MLVGTVVCLIVVLCIQVEMLTCIVLITNFVLQYSTEVKLHVRDALLGNLKYCTYLVCMNERLNKSCNGLQKSYKPLGNTYEESSETKCILCSCKRACTSTRNFAIENWLELTLSCS